MTGIKIQSAKVSKLMLAVALLLVFSLAFSPFAVAAKNSDKGKNDGQQDGASDNTQAPEKGHKDDNQAHEGKDKENHTKEDKHDSDNSVPEQPNQQDNDVHDQPDDNVDDQPDQPENDVQEQPDNNVPAQPEDNFQVQPDNVVDNQPEQPSQPDQSSNSPHNQPAISERIDRTSILENQAEMVAENLAENQPTEVLEPGESEQPAQDNQPLESAENLSDQSSSQQNQAAAGIASESGVLNVGVSFSESLSILGVGFGVLVAFRLIQAWIQQKYLSQIFALRIQLAGIVSPVYRFLGKVNLMNMRFGKIKCGAGFTKEEALAFFRQCQRLPLTWDRRYG